MDGHGPAATLSSLEINFKASQCFPLGDSSPHLTQALRAVFLHSEPQIERPKAVQGRDLPQYSNCSHVPEKTTIWKWLRERDPLSEVKE